MTHVRPAAAAYSQPTTCEGQLHCEILGELIVFSIARNNGRGHAGVKRS